MTTLRAAVAALGPWFHNLHLPDGTQTCPDHFLGDFPAFKWRRLRGHLPRHLHGWSVLDVGCNAGFYSFAMARRGAHVTAIDSDPHYLRQARWAARQYGLADRVVFQQRQVYSLSHTDQQWDLVLFMGVFYHLRYPLLGLDIVSRLTRQLLVFQSLTMPGATAALGRGPLTIDDRHRFLGREWPKMAFIEHELHDDPTNWWAPNPSCIEAMLRSAGMQIAARPVEEIYICRPSPSKPQLGSLRDVEYLAATGQCSQDTESDNR